MPDRPITRVHDPHLSPWQAVVAEQVRSELGEGHSNDEVAADPRMAAANRHVTVKVRKLGLMRRGCIHGVVGRVGLGARGGPWTGVGFAGGGVWGRGA
jgi:hypothetical protein